VCSFVQEGRLRKFIIEKHGHTSADARADDLSEECIDELREAGLWTDEEA
jgi:hypothetical protein